MGGRATVRKGNSRYDSIKVLTCFAQQPATTGRNQHNLRFFVSLQKSYAWRLYYLYSKHYEINTDFKGKVASREHLNTIWMTEDVYTAHPNATAKGQKLFHISFLKSKSGQVVNSNTLLSYQEDLSGLGCRTIVSHFHCSTSLRSSQITPIA